MNTDREKEREANLMSDLQPLEFLMQMSEQHLSRKEDLSRNTVHMKQTPEVKPIPLKMPRGLLVRIRLLKNNVRSQWRR